MNCLHQQTGALQKVEALRQSGRIYVAASHQLAEARGTCEQTVNDHQHPFLLKQRRSSNENGGKLALLRFNRFLILSRFILHSTSRLSTAFFAFGSTSI